MNLLRRYVRNSAVYRWRPFLAAALVTILGITFTVAGVVLLAMMGISGSLFGVVGAAAMLATGVVLTIGVYVWLTM